MTAGISGPATVAAQPDVRLTVAVLGTDDQSRSGFVDALQIQLGGEAEVVTASHLTAMTAGTALAIWFDDQIDGSSVLYAIEPGGDRAPIEIWRGELARGTNSDRVLALKVSALFDEVMARRLVADAPASAPAPAIDREIGGRATITARAPPTDRRVLGIADVGAAASLGASDPATQAGVVLGLGIELDARSWRVQLSAAALWHRDSRFANEAGTAELSELGLFLRASAARRFGRFAIGPRLGAGVRRVDVTAEASDGVAGARTRLIPAVELDLAASVRIVGSLEIRASAGSALSLVDESMTLRGQPIVELGRLRFPVELSLVFTIL